MKLSSLLGHTFELYDLTQHDRQPADQVVDRFFRARRYLGSRDRRFIGDAVFGLIRNKLLLETLIRTALGNVAPAECPSSQASILGLYTAHLAVIEKKEASSIVELLSSYWTLHFPRVPLPQVVEEIIRNYNTIREDKDFVNRVSILHSFPAWMVEEWLGRLGEPETEALCAALNVQGPTAIRVNTLKTSVEECQEALHREGIETVRTRLSPFGLVLAKRVNLPSLQVFKEGWFEVQDEGSQLIPLLLDPQPGETIIDACAGAGGKTLELAALVKNEGKIIALDVDQERLRNLQKRTERAGVQNVEVCPADKNSAAGEGKGSEKVDAVLIDAPCSGLGTLRRNPGNKWKVSPAFVEQLATQQRKLLDEWSRLVKSGGRLLYATCTLLRQENEDIVKDFLARHGEFRLVPSATIFSKFGLAELSQNKYLYLYPHRHGTDGFFAAVMVHC